MTIHLGWSAAYLTLGLILGWGGHWLSQNGERVKQVTRRHQGQLSKD